ncbi:hypothetical protein RQM65_03765 [Pricia sp. S334]|uniref:Membrane dipeptidase (Peptidase family M19) n=1 Tax=Pricia mediterranea TaxID=3076079 RepID=A0ABU3L216_9FLAO|nr:hypothetical protein [Pricia sp. S334]MDT7827781.1 hypothetical protein [Pricia sp. S334]
MDHYFDLHFHPLAKNHLANGREKPSDGNALKALTRPIAMSKTFKETTDETVLRTVESQSCIDYLREGKVHLGIAAVAALEFGIASSQGFIADILKSNLKKPLDDDYFDAVKEGEVSYLNLFLREVERYVTLRKNNIIEILNRNNVHTYNDKALKMTFAIEGGHNLCTKKIGNALEYDSFESCGNSSVFEPKNGMPQRPDVVLEELVNAFRKKDLDVLYLSLTHLTHIPEQHLATHAFGTKAMKHPSFYPFGNGLTDLGKEVIERAYGLKISTGNGETPSSGTEETPASQKVKNPPKEKKDVDNNTIPAPVLIDIAHMSLKSRQDLYNFRSEKGYQDIPLIASHTGVTGYSINDWKYHLDIQKCLNHVDQGIKTVKISTRPKVAGYWGSNSRKAFTFNPNSINLMDEDIIEVVQSNGLIGVSLDVGRLGNESDMDFEIDTSEFITTADFMTHFPYTGLQSLDYASVEEIRSESAWLKPVAKEMHPLGFCFNIVHLLAVIGLKANPKKSPAEYICVGSDLDGYIEPLRVCSDSRRMRDLESNLLKWLPVAVKRYQKENGGTADLFEFAKKKKELEKVVGAILYENGRAFIADRLVYERADEKKPRPPQKEPVQKKPQRVQKDR